MSAAEDPARVAFASWGSGGDLFPFLSPLQLVGGPDTEVIFALPRAQSAYMRALGVQPIALGAGAEIRLFSDDATLTVNDRGGASWHRLLDVHVADFVDATAGSPQLGLAWGCEAVISTDYGVHGRIAAALADVPAVKLSVVPHLAVIRDSPPRLREAIQRHGIDARTVNWAMSGDPDRTILVHDTALLDGGHFEGEPLGFPSFGAFRDPVEERRVETWLADGEGPTVVIAMGSFLGRTAGPRWHESVTAALATARRCIVVGCPEPVTATYSADGRVLSTPWVSLEWLLPLVDAVVHHGGLGTTIAAIRAGCPAVVVPIAFDQPINASMVERTGAGLDAGDGATAGCLRRLIGSTEATDSVRSLAAALVPGDVAATRIADRCNELMGWR